MIQSFRNFISAGGIDAGLGEFLSVLQIVLLALIIALSIGVIICVIFQESNTSGMGAIAGQNTETFYSKNKGRSLQGLLKRLTIIFSIAIVVLTVAYLVIIQVYGVTIA